MRRVLRRFVGKSNRLSRSRLGSVSCKRDREGTGDRGYGGVESCWNVFFKGEGGGLDGGWGCGVYLTLIGPQNVGFCLGLSM